MPPTTTDQYQQWHVDDFAPGIANQPGLNYPPGQAQQTNTYRCTSVRGALVPAPRYVDHIDGTAFETSTPTTSPGYLVDGIYAFGPLVATGTIGSTYEFELWLGVDYGLPASSGTKKHKLQRIRMYEGGTPTRDLIEDITVTSAADASFGWGLWFAASRANPATPTSPGVPIVVIAWGNINGASSYIITFPNASTPTSNTPYVVAHQTVQMTTHQNRIVVGNVTGYSHGSNAGLSTTEDLQWTPPNDPTSLSVLQTFYPEVTDGYQIIASMSANELFMLKRSTAIIATGDLNGAFITNLPLVAGTYTPQTPARSNQGLIYGSADSGIWAWSHGDNSRHLSPMMNPNFWMLPTEVVTANQYTFTSVGKWIFVGNNFFYDTDSNGWWRIDDDTFPIRYWTFFNQYLMGASSSYTNAAPLAVKFYDLTLAALDYSWQSQPIRESIDRMIETRGLAIRAVGTGTVQVYINGNLQGSTTTNSVTYTFATAVPQIQRQNLKTRGDNLSVRIVSTGTGGNVAPTVYEVFLDYQPIEPVAVSGTYA